MDFLRRLNSLFAGFTRARDRTLPGTVEQDERLTRFIFQRNYIDKARARAKPDALLPHGTPLQTSVFRTVDLDDEQVWGIGSPIAVERKRVLRARADFLAGAVAATALRLEPDNVPARHANIVGWPEEKAAQLMLASVIVAEANLLLRPQE